MSAPESLTSVRPVMALNDIAELLATNKVVAITCVDSAFDWAPLPDDIVQLASGDIRALQLTDRLLEKIDVADHGVLAHAVGVARRTGSSGCRLRWSPHAPDHPGREFSLRFFDLNETHAIVLGLIGDFEEKWVDTTVVPQINLRPRILVHQSAPTGHYKIVDPKTADLVGWEPSEMVNQSGLNFVHPDDQSVALDGWLRVLAGEDGSRQRFRFKTKHDGWLWMEATYTNELTSDGTGHIRVEQLNIEDEVDALAQARAVAAQFETLAQSLPVGVVHLDAHGRIIFANAWVRRLTTIASDSRSTSMNDIVFPADRSRLQRIIRECLDGAEADFDLRLLANGEVRRCRVRARPLMIDGEQNGVLGSIEDITESLLLQEQLQVEATTDHLTGLSNRAALSAELERLIKQSTLKASRFACLFIDLDDFKLINDGVGHHTGDAVLVTIAERLRAAVRPTDIVARVGGDEFIILCPWASSPAEVTGLADRLVQAVAAPLPCTIPPCTVTASVGIAMYDNDDLDNEVVLRNADLAMYEAKRAGGGTWEIYREALLDAFNVAAGRSTINAPVTAPDEADEPVEPDEPVASVDGAASRG